MAQRPGGESQSYSQWSVNANVSLSSWCIVTVTATETEERERFGIAAAEKRFRDAKQRYKTGC
jgi:hypothetical protein